MAVKHIFQAIGDEVKTIFSRKTKEKVYFSHNKFPSENEARKAFNTAKERLFNVDAWSKLPGLTSTFELHNKQGQRKQNELPEKGDFLRILLPGPLPENWVVITSIDVNDHDAQFVVSPSYNPKKSQDKSIKHFFIDEASSTFKVEHTGNEVRAYEIGKNEGINNKEEAGKRELINTLIAEGGWAGFQKIQWEKLTDYITQKLDLEGK